VVTVVINHESCFLLLPLLCLGVITSCISVNKLCSPNPIKLSISAYATLSYPGPAVSLYTLNLLTAFSIHPHPGDTSRAVPGRLHLYKEDAAQHQELAPATPKADLPGSEISNRVGLCRQPRGSP